MRNALDYMYGIKTAPSWCAACGTTHEVANAKGGQLEKWLKLLGAKFENAAKQIYRAGGYDIAMLQRGATKQLRTTLIDYFTNAKTEGFEHRDNLIPEAMRQKLDDDVFIFAGCKTHEQLKAVSALLRNKDGTVKPREQFIKEVQALHKGHLAAHLDAEYGYAVRAGQAAALWHQYEADGDRYDLQYRTASDDRVRESHVPLHNVTLPLNDAFWDRYFPPNGWRCRCKVVQVRKGKYPLSDSTQALQDGNAATGTPKLEIFRYNPGKQGVIFPPHHPYFKEQAKVAQALKDKAAGLTTVYESKNGATVNQHENADPKDLDYNLHHAKRLADAGENVIIAEHSYDEGVKNPELILEGGQIGDFKEPKPNSNPIRSIKNQISTANHQEAIPVIILNDKYYDREKTARAVSGEFNPDRNKNIKEVWFLFENGNLVKLQRTMRYDDIFKALP